MQQDAKYIRGKLMRVASGLFSWRMVAGLLAFSSRQFALTIKHEPFFVLFTLFFLPKHA